MGSEQDQLGCGQFEGLWLSMKLNPLLGAISVAILLSGCAGRYVAPDRGAPQATLHIVTDHPHRTISGWRYYSDSRCSDSSSVRLGAFSALYEKEKRVQIPAGEKRFLFVNTTTSDGAPAYSCGAPACFGVKACKIEFEVTPVAGRTYLARHSGTGEGCSVEISDESTGAATTDVKQIAVTPTCK